MAVEKVSMSLDEDVVAAARERVGGRGLSGYANVALERQLRRDALSELLDDLREQDGPVPDALVEEVRQQWPALADDASRPA